MSILRPEQATFRLLDIHSESIESARATIDSLGFAEFVTGYETVDASRYRIPEDERPQIILSETMNAALEKEPQVAIARNLFAQAPDAALVPEAIQVDACLADLSREFNTDQAGPDGVMLPPGRQRIALGAVFELSANTIREWNPTEGTALAAREIQLPDVWPANYQPRLTTTVRVWRDDVLRDYETSLTNLLPFPDAPAIRAGGRIQFRYRLGEHPGLTCA